MSEQGFNSYKHTVPHMMGKCCVTSQVLVWDQYMLQSLEEFQGNVQPSLFSWYLHWKVTQKQSSQGHVCSRCISMCTTNRSYISMGLNVLPYQR